MEAHPSRNMYDIFLRQNKVGRFILLCGRAYYKRWAFRGIQKRESIQDCIHMWHAKFKTELAL